MSFFDLPPIIERMLLISDKISDLNFSVGQLPQVEINGKLTPVQPLGMQKLSPYQTEIIALIRAIGRTPVQRTTTYGRIAADGVAGHGRGVGWRSGGGAVPPRPVFAA